MAYNCCESCRGQLPDRTASISPSHVLVMSALTLRTRRHPTRCRPQTYGKLTLNVELAGAARLIAQISVLMDGSELQYI